MKQLSKDELLIRYNNLARNITPEASQVAKTLKPFLTVFIDIRDILKNISDRMPKR